MFRLPYGYTVNHDERVVINEKEAANVKFIFQNYLSGDSIKKIASNLSNAGVSPPFENKTWSYETINKILSDPRYVPHIIGEEQFFDVQFEKEKRSSVDPDTGKRKATRYNSQNVLSGLLVCADCGFSYRRITRSSGEVVWRCADKVEKGKRSACGNKNTITDVEIKRRICETLDLDVFDERVIRANIEQVLISNDGINIREKPLQISEIML